MIWSSSADPGRQADANQQKTMQAVFRLPLLSTTRASKANLTPEKSSFYARRSHKKSRTGCKSCKQRRIKCDENRDGGCFKCQHHGIDCDYNREKQPQSTGYLILRKQQPQRSSQTTFDDVETTYLARSSCSKSSSRSSTPLSLIFSLSPPFPLEVPSEMTPIVQTFNHFGTVTSCSMGSGMGQEISKGPALRLALEKPYLMHAINGVSADHLCHLLPVTQNPIQHVQSQLASVYHWQRAFELVRNELSTRVTKDNMDALMSTIMLIGVHQFMLTETRPDPSKSFIYAPVHQREDCLNFLQINRGFAALQVALGDDLRESVWLPVLQDSDIKEQSAKIMTPEAGDDTHALFLEFCEVTPASSPKNNPYYDALQCLLFLRLLKPSINKFNKVITFIGVIENGFLRLLIERERRALLILAHWLGLMSELKQWWHSSRCKSECLAITTFLMHDPDERVRILLKYPARTVGIVLTHVEE